MRIVVAMMVCCLVTTRSASAQGASTNAMQQPACNEACIVSYGSNGEIVAYGCMTGASGPVAGWGCGASAYGCAVWQNGCSGYAVSTASGEFLAVVESCQGATDPASVVRQVLFAPDRDLQTFFPIVQSVTSVGTLTEQGAN